MTVNFSKILTLAIVAMFFASTTAFAQSAPYCCGSPHGTYYPDMMSCMMGIPFPCGMPCGPCSDLDLFDFNCQGYYGYQYSCMESDGGDDGGKAQLNVRVESACDGNVVTVTADGEPYEYADVFVKDMAAETVTSGPTDEDGLFTFSVTPELACGEKVDVYAKDQTGDYDKSETFTLELIDCAQCGEQPECTSDDQCPTHERCTDEVCVPIQCGPCQTYGAAAPCVDLCSADQMCSDNTCVDKTTDDESSCVQPECCLNNDQCVQGAYCMKTSPNDERGSCERMPDCSELVNGQVATYECGDFAGCPQCDGVCKEHSCLEVTVTCEQSATAADVLECTVTDENGDAVPGHSGSVTVNGEEVPYTSDGAGHFSIDLGGPGSYNVQLGKNSIHVDIPGPGTSPTAPTGGQNGGIGGLLFLLLLLLLLGAGALFWIFRGKFGMK